MPETGPGRVAISAHSRAFVPVERIAQAFRLQSDSTCNKVGDLVSRSPCSYRRGMRMLSTVGRRGGKYNDVILR